MRVRSTYIEDETLGINPQRINGVVYVFVVVVFVLSFVCFLFCFLCFCICVNDYRWLMGFCEYRVI